MRPDALRSAIAARPQAGRKPLDRHRQRGYDCRGRHRPVPRAVADLPGRGSGCTWTAPTAPSPRSPNGGGRRSPESSSPTRSRSIRTSGSISRSSWVRCSCATASALRRGFEISPDFLKDVEAVDREVNFSDLGVQLTRSCRALKLWISLRYFGVPAFRRGDRSLPRPGTARQEPHRGVSRARADVASIAGRRHVPAPSGRGRRRGILERINADLADHIERGGELFISTGRVRGRYVLRLCMLNHSTSQAEVDRALELAETLEIERPGCGPSPSRSATPSFRQGWLRRPTLDTAAFALAPLFASLSTSCASASSSAR